MADSYSKWIMTTAFANNSQAALNSGGKIEWVALKTSDDTHSVNDLPGFNNTTLATTNIKQTASISTVSISNNTVTITSLFNSTGNASDYYIRTIFLVAKYNGTEFLAGATVANTSGSAFRMPAASSTEITEFTARPQISVTNTNSISTTVDPVASATNERVDSLEATLQGEINDINTDKQNLWNKLADYVTKAASETITGVKTFSQTIVGSITGNAGTATKLQTGRKINDKVFDGTADIVVNANNDADIVHKSGTEIVTGKKIFSLPINGALATREATFTDFNAMAASLQKYQGKWRGGYDSIANSPEPGWFIADIMTWSDDNNLGYIVLHYADHNAVWFGLAISGAINWSRVSNDSTVVHNTDNENIGGTKTFINKINGSLNGNAGSATKLLAARKISLTGDVTGSGTFDGTGDLEISVTEKQVTQADTTSTQATVNGDTIIMVDSVSRNSAGEVTAVNTKTVTLPPAQTSVSGNAGTADLASKATKLATTRSIGGVPFDGTTGIDLPGVNKTGNQDTTGNAASSSKLQIRLATFTDFSTVAANMNMYAGEWYVANNPISNSPLDVWYNVTVHPGNGNGNGFIELIKTYGGQPTKYIAIVDLNTLLVC